MAARTADTEFSSSASTNSFCVPDLESKPDATWDLGQKRFEVLEPLVDRKVSNKEAEQAARSLALSRAQVFKLIKRLRANRHVSALVKTSVGRKSAVQALPERQEAVVASVILEQLGRREPSTVASVYEAVKIACAREGVKRPCHRYIAKRWATKTNYEQAVAKLGRKDANHLCGPRMGGVVVSSILQQIQIDHTLADLIILDSETGKIIGRPWITLAIDVCSRAILGMHLSLEAPSSATLAAVLTMAVFGQAQFLRDREMTELSWSYFGLPDEVFVDNGSDMRSKAFSRGCADNNIRLSFRRSVQAGGIIERLIGTFMSRLRFLPGTICDSKKLRKVYDSESNAQLTIWDAERWVIGEIVRYHNTVHRGLGVPPAVAWERGFMSRQQIPTTSRSAQQFFVSMLPTATRIVQIDGVHFETQRYVSDAIVTRIGQTVSFHYHPLDHRHIYLREKDDRVSIAANSDRSEDTKVYSFGELRRRRSLLSASNKAGGCLALAEQAAIVQEDIVKSARDRRKAESRRRRSSEHAMVVSRAPSNARVAAVDYEFTATIIQEIVR